MDNLGLIDILLVEDNPADAHLIIEFFKDFEDNTQIKHVKDGAESLNYLYQRGKYKNASLPNIIILDMNLPKIEGMTVLETIKRDDNLKRIPVIIFGTSSDPKEVKNAYKNYVNCYIVKPIDFDQLKHNIKCIVEFWSKVVTLHSRL